MYRALVAALFFGCAWACGADAQPQGAFPLWDGRETIEQYARRVKLPATQTLDLGNGVKLELVLIPAGKFVMGTAEPAEPESPWIGGAILAIGVLVVLALVGRLLWRAVRQHRRPQFSLLWLIVVVLILGVAQYGGFRCWRAIQALGSGVSPTHEVTLTTPFYMSKFETTQEQHAQVIGANPSNFKGANLPVETVSWDDAAEFCKKVSEKTGQTVRLPSEAEWEFACRAGTTTAYFTGDADSDLCRAAWCAVNSGGKTHPVGQKEPNAFGLFDMHGNVKEWCRDWYEPYEPEAVVDPQGPAKGECRVLRGGFWTDTFLGSCRSAYRTRDNPGSRNLFLGFRVAVEMAPRLP